jgi:hypothetical protein
MEDINRLLDNSRQLKISLDRKNEDRDNLIAKVVTFVDDRGRILEAITPEILSTDDKEKLKEILLVSEEIIHCMNELKMSIHEDILQSKKGKTALLGYSQQVMISDFDGRFIDKKK